MANTATATPAPLARTQDELTDRMRLRLNDTSDDELRHIALAHVLDRAHAAQVIAEDDPRRDELLAGFPEHAPGHHQVMAGVVQQALPSLLAQIRNTRTALDMLSENAWVLGNGEVAEQMTPNGGHAALGEVGLVEVVRFCRAFRIPLPGEGSEEGMDADLAQAVATLEREQQP